jgi:hypothetical protein
MKTASRLLIASLASFAFVGTALAQDTPPDGTQPDPNAVPDPNATGTDPNGAPAMGDPNAAPAHGKWPRSVILRPLTLPAGVFMVGVDLVNISSSFFDPAVIGVRVGYGITDDIELAFAGYAFSTSDVGKGDLAAGLGYKLARGAAGGKMEAIARLQLGYNLGAEGLDPLGLGVQVQYNVNEKIALFTPGNQLGIGLEEPNAIAFDLPVGAGFQATPELFAYLQTSLLTIAIKDAGDSTFIFADRTPLELGAIYNVMPALDVQVAISTDLSNSAFDPFAILIGARYYGGKLN